MKCRFLEPRFILDRRVRPKGHFRRCGGRHRSRFSKLTRAATRDFHAATTGRLHSISVASTATYGFGRRSSLRSSTGQRNNFGRVDSQFGSNDRWHLRRRRSPAKRIEGCASNFLHRKNLGERTIDRVYPFVARISSITAKPVCTIWHANTKTMRNTSVHSNRYSVS